MRLVGGNIGDSPVKNVHDGSAFAAAGGATIPTLPTFSGEGTAAQFSNITYVTSNASLSGIAANFKMAECQWTNNSASIFWLDAADGQKLKHVRLSFTGSTGLLSAESSAQDLSANLTGTTSCTLRIVRVSATRCVVVYLHDASARVVKFLTYDLSGDTVTLHGAVQTYTVSNNTSAFHGMHVTKLDNDYLAFFNTQATNESALTIVKYTTTQSIGTTVLCGTAGSGTACYGRCSYDPVTGKIFHFDGYDMWTEWTYSGTTATFGAILFDNMNLPFGANAKNDEIHFFRHDIDAGRMITVDQGDSDYYQLFKMFTGRTLKRGTRGGMSLHKTHYGFYQNDGGTPPGVGASNQVYNAYMKCTIDYDEDTFWERRVLVSRHFNTAVIVLHPCVFNWDTQQLVQIEASDAEHVDMGSGNYGINDPLPFFTGDDQTTLFIIVSDSTDDTTYNTITVNY